MIKLNYFVMLGSMISAFLSFNVFANENQRYSIEIENKLTEILEYYKKDNGIKVTRIFHITTDNEGFLERNANEILDRLRDYAGVKFEFNKHWFIAGNTESLKVFKSKNVDLDFIEISAYTCENCLRLNDLLLDFKRFKNFRNLPITIDMTFVPIAIRDDVRKKYLISDAMVTLALEESIKDSDIYKKVNNRLIFDTVYNHLSIIDEAKMKVWLEKNGVDYREFKKSYEKERNVKLARIIADNLTEMKRRTVPMVVINNKYILLKNIVNTIDKRFYNEDISMALLDYVSILALLERKGLVSVEIASGK